MAKQPLTLTPDSSEAMQEDVLSSMGFNDEEDLDLNGEGDDDESGTGDDLPDETTTGSVDDDQLPDDEEISKLTKEYKADGKGNLVDDKGKIVARAGPERTAFERTKKALSLKQQELNGITQHLQKVAAAGKELLTKYNALKEEASYGDKLGLTKEESKEAIDVFNRMKHDAKSGLKYILTKMSLAGHDLTDLGVSGPLDASAVAAEAIRKHIASTKPVEKSPEDQATETANQFLERFPRARQDIAIIAQAKQHAPEMSLDEIWVRLAVHRAVEAFKAKNQPQQRQRSAPNNAPTVRNQNSRQEKRRSLDNSPRDPKSSFHLIGQDLLKELKEMES